VPRTCPPGGGDLAVEHLDRDPVHSDLDATPDAIPGPGP
jgi:hypothetical protein